MATTPTTIKNTKITLKKNCSISMTIVLLSGCPCQIHQSLTVRQSLSPSYILDFCLAILLCGAFQL